MTALGVVVLTAVVLAAAVVLHNLRAFRRAPVAHAATPTLSILIPARNEADTIETAVRSAAGQRGVVEVLVLDDGSTDATPAILARLALELPALRVMAGRSLPERWAGKSWACWQLANAARGEWLLFIDADVRLHAGAAARALTAARDARAAFLSAFPRQRTGSLGEALVVPMIHLVLLTFLPLALVGRRTPAALSAGCGQFMLARRSAYLLADGHRADRATLHDGLMLARRMKRAGFPVDVLDGTDLADCRMYRGLAAAWRGFARNAYEALGSPAVLAAFAVLSVTLYVAPFVGLAWAVLAQGAAVAPWAAAALIVLALRAAMAARFHHRPWTPLLTPVAVVLMITIQLHSFINHATRRPVVWRARAYAPRPAGGA